MSEASDVDASLRIRSANDRPVAADGDYVLYWMIAARRTKWNFALDRAVTHAKALDKPLLVFEPLRNGYLWASDRLHRFVIEGMLDNRDDFESTSALYYPYVEPYEDADKGLLAALARRACVVVTDEFPAFFLPRMVTAAARRLDVRVELVDSNGLLPLRATDRMFPSAYQFRRYLQRELPRHLAAKPKSSPVKRARLRPLKKLPAEVLRRWPPAALERLLSKQGLAKLPIDHGVGPAAFCGGAAAAGKTLKRFLDQRLVSLSRRAQRAGGRRHQRPFALLALRPRLGTRGVRQADETGELVAGKTGRQGHGQPRGLVGQPARRPKRFSTNC